MQWSDEGIVLSARRHGENGALLSVLSALHGRHAGLVKGGGGQRAKSALQPGNRLYLTWKARLPEQLGLFVQDLAEPSGTRWLDDASRLAAIASACALAETTLPEREAHPKAYQALVDLLGTLIHDDWPSLYVHWELGLLTELGFGLELSCCAATGTTRDLTYVSPKSGAAVCTAAGKPYHDRLLPLPAFLIEKNAGSASDVVDGLRLTGYFLERNVLAGKALPPARLRLVGHIRP